MELSAPILAQWRGVLITHDDDLTRLKTVVSERMLARMVALGITQAELEERTGIDQAQLSRYETATSAPTIPTVIRLAKALDCTAGYLIGQESEPQPTTVPIEAAYDPLGSLTDDERFILLQYRERRASLQSEVINEGIAVLANPLRDEIKRLLSRILHEQGKFDNRRNNP